MTENADTMQIFLKGDPAGYMVCDGVGLDLDRYVLIILKRGEVTIIGLSDNSVVAILNFVEVDTTEGSRRVPTMHLFQIQKVCY